MNIIQLASERYEVRVKSRKRQIKVSGEWMDADLFPDHLVQAGKLDQWSELVGLGYNKMHGITPNKETS
jgi:hypothetical protein